MNLYSHIVLARRLEPYAAPEDPGEFYWGAVVPDIRYLAGMGRDRTHLTREQMSAARARYPDLGSFLLGYQVHCLLDELDLARIIASEFPLRLARRWMAQKQTAMLVELYYQETARFYPRIQATHNAFLSDLGIALDHTAVYARALNQYFSHPSLQTMLSIAQDSKLHGDPRVQGYLRAAESILRSPLIKNLLFYSLRKAGFDQIAVSHVRTALAAHPLPPSPHSAAPALP